MKNSKKILLRMSIGSITSLLFASSFYLIFLPSKNKSFFGLYSNDKFIVISALISLIFVILINKRRIDNYLQKKSKVIDNKYNNKTHNNNIVIIIIMSTIIYAFSLLIDPTIKGDFVIQYFTNSQYTQNLSSEPYIAKLILFNQNDLSQEKHIINKWSAGIFYILNMMQTVSSLNTSESLRLLGFMFSLLSSIYTYKIIELFTQDYFSLKIIAFLAILMPFVTGLSYISFSNCDLFSVSLVTPCIFYTILLIRHIDEEKKYSSKLFFYLVILTIILGSIVIFKKSTYIISASVFIFIMFYYVKSFKKMHVIRVIALSAIFILPLLLHLKSCRQSPDTYTFKSDTEKKGEKLSAVQKEKLYYDNLLGQYHSNSTNGLQLFFTSLASPGWYALGNSTFCSFSDLLSMNKKIKSFLFCLAINQYTFFAFIFSIPISFLLLFLYSKEKVSYPRESTFLLFVIVSTTIVLCYITNLNQCFNYIINRDFRYKLPIGILLQCYLLFKIYKLRFFFFKSFIFYFTLSYFFTYPLLSFCIYYTNHYTNAGISSLNGFFTYRNISTINRETNQYISLTNNEYTSSEILNIIITDDKPDGYAYFMASELKGNIAFSKSDDLSFLKYKPDNIKCVHVFIHKNTLNQSNITKSALSIPKNLSSYTPIYSYLHIT